MKRNLLIVALFIVVALSAGTISHWRSSGQADTTQDAQAKPNLKVEAGYPAPDFTLSTLDGKVVTLSQLKGKPVYINFWATWCPPCRDEMPEIQRFFEKHKEEVNILLINLTVSEKSPAEVKKFLERNGYIFPVLLDTDGSVARSYLVRAIPTSFFLDAQGIIRYKYTGPVTVTLLEDALKLAQSSK